jgi:hypothetical protein
MAGTVYGHHGAVTSTGKRGSGSRGIAGNGTGCPRSSPTSCSADGKGR